MAVSVVFNYTLDFSDDTDPFIGAFATVDRPDASTVPPGYYYFDLTVNAPYWSDGSEWVEV